MQFHAVIFASAEPTVNRSCPPPLTPTHPCPACQLSPAQTQLQTQGLRSWLRGTAPVWKKTNKTNKQNAPPKNPKPSQRQRNPKLSIIYKLMWKPHPRNFTHTTPGTVTGGGREKRGRSWAGRSCTSLAGIDHCADFCWQRREVMGGNRHLRRERSWSCTFHKEENLLKISSSTETQFWAQLPLNTLFTMYQDIHPLFCTVWRNIGIHSAGYRISALLHSNFAFCCFFLYVLPMKITHLFLKHLSDI